MPQALTTAQAAVLAFIVTHLGAHQRPPTRLEISRQFGWRSQNAACDHVKALHRKGWIDLKASAIGGQGQRYIQVLHGVSATAGPTHGTAAGTRTAAPCEPTPSA